MASSTDVLKSVVETKLGLPCSFIFADLNEANLGLDKYKDIDFPVFIYVAPTKEKSNKNDPYNVHRVIDVNGFFFLQRSNDITIDFTYEKVEPLIVTARLLTDKLVKFLEKESITDKSTEGITSWECNGVYGELDSHLFGTSVSFQWPVLDKFC